MSALPRRGAVASIRAIRRAQGVDAARSRCDTCRAEIGTAHDHLVLEGGFAISCACVACALAAPPGRRVRRSVVRLARPAPSAAIWAALDVPVDVAIVFVAERDGARQFVARYPNPAGVIEARLTDEAAVHAALPEVQDLQPDVEALLIDRRRDVVLRVSIDVGFELCARVRGSRSPGVDLDARVAELELEAQHDRRSRSPTG